MSKKIPAGEIPPDLQKFIQSRIDAVISQLRSENTRECARKILAILEKEKETPPGWVQSSEIFNKLGEYNPSTVTRLLKSLSDPESLGIIERDVPQQEKPRPGKPAVFYRIPPKFDLDRINHLLSREELIEGNKTLNKLFNNYHANYQISKALLRECGVKDPEAAVQARRLEKIKEFYTELKKTDEEIQKEAKERMKDADLGPGEMLSPEEDLDKED